VGAGFASALIETKKLADSPLSLVRFSGLVLDHRRNRHVHHCYLNFSSIADKRGIIGDIEGEAVCSCEIRRWRIGDIGAMPERLSVDRVGNYVPVTERVSVRIARGQGYRLCRVPVCRYVLVVGKPVGLLTVK